MNFTVSEFLAWAQRHEDRPWTTLVRRVPFRYQVHSSGIEYIPQTEAPRNVPRRELETFCDDFLRRGSFAPGEYPERWHKSYTLPLLRAFLLSKEEPTGEHSSSSAERNAPVNLDDPPFDQMVSLRKAYRIMERFVEAHIGRGVTSTIDLISYFGLAEGNRSSDPAALTDYLLAAAEIIYPEAPDKRGSRA
jgi:hypothetical protein